MNPLAQAGHRCALSVNVNKVALLHGSMAALQQACAPVLPQLKSALRGLLHYHLGGKPLRTRQVMLDVQKLLD